MKTKLVYLKDKINSYENIDISEKTRVRNIVYYRKIFCKIGRCLNFTLQEIGDVLNLSHDSALHHARTFDMVYNKHKKVNNDLVDFYNLDKSYLMLTDEMTQEDLEKELEDKKKSKEFFLKSQIAYREHKKLKLLDYLDEVIDDLCDLSNEQVKSLVETRIKPFLKMNKLNNQ